jgi:hypothetical protein
MNDINLHAEIVQVALRLYEKSGRVEGRDLDNWLEAESIVRARYAAKVGNKDEVIESSHVKGAQRNALDSSYSKITDISFGGGAMETTVMLEKESGIKRLSLLRENEKTYLKSLDLFQTELKIIEEELLKASGEMYQKKMRLSKIEDEIVILKAQINKIGYRNRIAATISIFSFIIFVGMLVWYFKPVAFLFGVVFLGLVVYSFFNFANRHRIKSSISKKNQETNKLLIDWTKLREAESFCKNKHNQKVDMIEKQIKELEATAAKISEVKSNIVALEEKEKIHYEILEQDDDNMSIEEKRKYERRAFVKPIIYYLTDPHMEELKKIEFDGVSVDISEGGLGIITDYPFMPGDNLFFQFEIKVNDFAAKSSIVRWAREIGESNCRVGLEFVR